MENEGLWGNNGEQTVAEPISTPEASENLTSIDSENSVEQQSTKPTPQESFQEMRAKTDKLQKERDEALNTIRKIEEYALQQQRQSQTVREPEPEPDEELDDDDYVEAKIFKKKIHALESQLNRFNQQQQSSSVEQQLRSKYNDFDRVMTFENISKLRELKPEIAYSLHQSSDLYNKAAATYTILKEMGIHKEDIYAPERERVEVNANKPRAAASLQRTDSPLSHASEFSGSKLSNDRKKQIYEQMMRNTR